MTGAPPRARRIRRWAADARDLSLHYLMRLLPTETCSALGAWLGGAIGPRAHRLMTARAQAALSRLQPTLDRPKALEAASRGLWAGVGRVFAEYSVLGRLPGEGRIAEAQAGRLQALLADARPLILCFLHLGNWDVALMHAARMAPGRMIVVALPSESRIQTQIVGGWRRSLPMDTRWVHPGVWKAVLQRLQRPGGIAYIAADEPDGGSIGGPFLGRPPRIDGNLGKMVRLAAATGARIVPIYAERLAGVRFLVHTLPEVEVSGATDEGAVLADALRIDALIDPVVRRLADQWVIALGFGKDVKAITPTES